MKLMMQHLLFSGFWSFWESVNSCQAMLLQIGLLVSFVTREFFKEFVKMLFLFCVVLMRPKQITPYLRRLSTILQPELQLIHSFIMLKKSTQVSITLSNSFFKTELLFKSRKHKPSLIEVLFVMLFITTYRSVNLEMSFLCLQFPPKTNENKST